MSEIVSVTEKSWPDLFHEGISMFAGKTNTSNTNNRNRLKKNLGLQENEQDILSLINSDINNENLTNVEDEDDTLPDLNPRQTTLEAFLLGDESSLCKISLINCKISMQLSGRTRASISCIHIY